MQASENMIHSILKLIFEKNSRFSTEVVFYVFEAVRNKINIFIIILFQVNNK